jgi:hypothetical protein
MTEHEKKIYDGVKRKQIYDKVNIALEFFEDLTKHSTKKEYPGEFMQEKFPHFLQILIETSREDEEKHQKSIRRIENLKAWINSSEFNDSSKHYCMSITLLGYDNLEEMKKEVTDYAPDYLDAFALFNNTEGLGGSFLLKDYEANKNNSTQHQTVVDEKSGSVNAPTLAEEETKLEYGRNIVTCRECDARRRDRQ